MCVCVCIGMVCEEYLCVGVVCEKYNIILVCVCVGVVCMDKECNIMLLCVCVGVVCKECSIIFIYILFLRFDVCIHILLILSSEVCSPLFCEISPLWK